MFSSLLTVSMLLMPAQPPLEIPGRAEPKGPPAELLLPEPKLPIIAPPKSESGATLRPIKAAKTPTMREFADNFQPLPGVHDATMIHPFSGKPVDVTFKLPEGKPKVRVLPRSIVFEYPRHEVTIIFRLFGQADVRYN